MLGVLLETRANRQRRAGGVALSVAAHAAIIGAAVVGTVQGTPAPRTKEPPVIVRFDAPKPTRSLVRQVAADRQSSPSLPADVVVRRIDAPTITPVGLPPIDAPLASVSDSLVIGPTIATPGARSVIDGEAHTGSREWSANDVLMHVLTPARPRYPESLRSAGLDGRVLVQFTVDTTGRVDMASLRILSATHELFARSVREAIGNFRFRPAEVGGRRVAALAEMPFEFQITR